jgi:hypothetical protein
LSFQDKKNTKTGQKENNGGERNKQWGGWQKPLHFLHLHKAAVRYNVYTGTISGDSGEDKDEDYG